MLAALVTAVLITAPGAVTQEVGQMPDAAAFPGTPDEFYQVGQRFASCAATFTFTGEVARRANFNETAIAAEDQARGWRLAGLMFLAEGMSPGQERETEATFGNLEAAAVQQLRARYEMNPTQMTREGPADYQRNCGPYLPMLRAMIESIRRGPATEGGTSQ